MPNENGSSRLDRIERAIENLSFQMENQRVNNESLHANVGELHDIVQKQGVVMDKLGQIMDKVIAATAQDGENIRALARIAEMHERRLT
jgi:hypothetical protein